MTLVAVFEGDTDLPVVRKLAAASGIELSKEIDAGGKSRIDPNLDDYDRAARGSPWFVLRDLDQDAPCAPELVARLLPTRSSWMCFRIAVHEVEAWLMADATGLARFLGVPVDRVPVDPDAEPNATHTLVELARRSKKRAVRQAMVPREGRRSPVGPEYEAFLIEFATRHWSLERAARRSPSLARAWRALQELARRWRAKTDGKDE